VAIKIIEIKARHKRLGRVREYLESHGAEFKGRDHQVDTYFQVKTGRLKLREGTIENSFIFYDRPIQSGPKRSDVVISRPSNPGALKTVLVAALPVRVVVDKQREIYFIDNVKFHIDDVRDLGQFVEIEAIDASGERTEAELLQQCEFYMAELGVRTKNLVPESYSELLLA
jgi:adenylate cyclase, class 2